MKDKHDEYCTWVKAAATWTRRRYTCDDCEGEGYRPEYKELVESFAPEWGETPFFPACWSDKVNCKTCNGSGLKK